MTELTDADLTYFWLGPLGYLRQLPLLPVRDSVNATEELIGGLTVGMDGTGTLDVFGFKRSWQLDWVCLELLETRTQHALFQGLTRSPVRIVDPRAGNRLTRDGASGGSRSRDVTAHTVTAGTRSFVAVTDYPADYLGLIDGGISWSVPVSTAATLRIDATDKIPLIPGEQVRLAVLLASTGSAQVGVQPYDVAGAAGSTSLASSVTLGSWTWYSHTFTPSATQVSASLIVVAASGAARTVRVGPALWHPDSTDWVPGTGCPRVLLTGSSTRYPGVANRDAGLVVREA